MDISVNWEDFSFILVIEWKSLGGWRGSEQMANDNQS